MTPLSAGGGPPPGTGNPATTRLPARRVALSLAVLAVAVACGNDEVSLLEAPTPSVKTLVIGGAGS